MAASIPSSLRENTGSRSGFAPIAAANTTVVSVVNDGVLLVSFDDLVTTDRAACERSQGESFRATPPWLTINCFLIRSGGTLALVDAGLRNPRAVVRTLDLRGRRVRRALIVFTQEDADGAADLGVEAVPVDEAASAVVAALRSE